jgi:hypothetical protein
MVCGRRALGFTDFTRAARTQMTAFQGAASTIPIRPMSAIAAFAQKRPFRLRPSAAEGRTGGFAPNPVDRVALPTTRKRTLLIAESKKSAALSEACPLFVLVAESRPWQSYYLSSPFRNLSSL